MSDPNSTQQWPVYQDQGTQADKTANGPQDPRPGERAQLTEPEVPWWFQPTIISPPYRAMTLRQIKQKLVNSGYVASRESFQVKSTYKPIAPHVEITVLRALLFLADAFPARFKENPLTNVGATSRLYNKRQFVDEPLDNSGPPVVHAANRILINVHNMFANGTFRARHPKVTLAQSLAHIEGAVAASVAQKLLAGSTHATLARVTNAIAEHTHGWQYVFPFTSLEATTAFREAFGKVVRYPTFDANNWDPKANDLKFEGGGHPELIIDINNALVTGFCAHFHHHFNNLSVGTWEAMLRFHGPHAAPQERSDAAQDYAALHPDLSPDFKHFEPTEIPTAILEKARMHPPIGFTRKLGYGVKPVEGRSVCYFRIADNRYVLFSTEEPDAFGNPRGNVILDATRSARARRPVYERVSDGHWFITEHAPIFCITQTSEFNHEIRRVPHLALQLVDEAISITQKPFWVMDSGERIKDERIANMNGQRSTLFTEATFLLDQAKTSVLKPIARVDTDLRTELPAGISNNSYGDTAWNTPNTLQQLDYISLYNQTNDGNAMPEKLIWEVRSDGSIEDSLMLFPHGVLIAVDRGDGKCTILMTQNDLRIGQTTEPRYVAFPHQPGSNDIKWHRRSITVSLESIERATQGAPLSLEDTKGKTHQLGTAHAIHLIEPSFSFTRGRLNALGFDLHGSSAKSRSDATPDQDFLPGFGLQ